MNPIRFGLIGASGIADRSFVPAIKKSSKAVLMAVAARDRVKAKSFADKHSISKTYGSYEEMLADPEIDAVYISLPNHLHAIWGMKSLHAGKHVLIEKPITNSTKELEQLFSLASKNKLVVMEAFMFLYNDRLQKVLEMIAQGVIGEVRTVHADFSIPLNNKNDIRYLNEPGSGGLADLGTYTNMLAEQVMGSWPTSIDCRLIKVAPKHHADIQYSALMEYPDGKKALISGGFNTQITCEAIIIGEKGRILLHDFLWCDRETEIHLRCGDKTEQIDVATRNHYIQEIDDMADSIRTGKEPKVSKRISLNHRKVLDYCLESAQRNKTVRIKQSSYI